MSEFSKTIKSVVQVTSEARLDRKFREIVIHTPEILSPPDEFVPLFMSSLSNLKVEGEKSQPLLVYYHCHLMRQNGFPKFQYDFPKFAVFDKRISEVSEDMVRSFCVDPAPASARLLFSNPVLTDAIALLKEGWEYEVPLIALPRIASAIELLNDIYFLSNGSPAQADALTPLIHYLLMKCGIGNIYSYVKYLDGYVRKLVEEGLLHLPEVVLVALTHMANHVDSLAGFLTEIAWRSRS
jgi:hypothetical protein